MIYTTSITAPASTLETAAVDQVLTVARGIIHRVEIQIPHGHFALAKMTISLGGHQIIPLNKYSYINGNGETFIGIEHINLLKETNELTLRMWNDDDFYAHTFYIRVEILREEELNPLALIAFLLERLLRRLGA